MRIKFYTSRVASSILALLLLFGLSAGGVFILPQDTAHAGSYYGGKKSKRSYRSSGIRRSYNHRGSSYYGNRRYKGYYNNYRNSYYSSRHGGRYIDRKYRGNYGYKRNRHYYGNRNSHHYSRHGNKHADRRYHPNYGGLRPSHSYYGRPSHSYYGKGIKRHSSKRYYKRNDRYYRHQRGVDRVPTRRQYIGEKLVIALGQEGSEGNARPVPTDGYQECAGTLRCSIRRSSNNGPAIIRLGDPYASNTPKIITFEGSQ